LIFDALSFSQIPLGTSDQLLHHHHPHRRRRHHHPRQLPVFKKNEMFGKNVDEILFTQQLDETYDTLS